MWKIWRHSPLTFQTNGFSLCHWTVLGAHTVSSWLQPTLFPLLFSQYCSLVLKTGPGKRNWVKCFCVKTAEGEGQVVAGCCCKMLLQGHSMPWCLCLPGTSWEVNVNWNCSWGHFPLEREAFLVMKENQRLNLLARPVESSSVEIS